MAQVNVPQVVVRLNVGVEGLSYWGLGLNVGGLRGWSIEIKNVILVVATVLVF